MSKKLADLSARVMRGQLSRRDFLGRAAVLGVGAVGTLAIATSAR